MEFHLDQQLRQNSHSSEEYLNNTVLQNIEGG